MGGKRAIADQRKNLTRFIMHGKLKLIGADLVDKKVASNMGRGRGVGPVHTPKKVGLAKSRLLGGLAGRESADEDDNIMRDMAYHKRRGGVLKGVEGDRLYINSPKLN